MYSVKVRYGAEIRRFSFFIDDHNAALNCGYIYSRVDKLFGFPSSTYILYEENQEIPIDVEGDLKQFVDKYNEKPLIRLVIRSKEKGKEKEIEKSQSNFIMNDNDISTIDTITHFYVDGNNLLYVCDIFRYWLLRQRKKRKVEQVLSYIALEYAKLKGFKYAVVIFDRPSSELSEQIYSDSLKFCIATARPFPTSDDRLVFWAEQNGDLNKTSLFVTSDRGLRNRLSILGGNLLKSKAWLIEAAKALGKAEDISLDDWIKGLPPASIDQ